MSHRARDDTWERPLLRRDARGLSLTGGGMTLRGDFTRMLRRLRPESLRGELLVRAARIRTVAGAPTAIDATAGLGEDALLLAAAGFSVTLFERDPTVAALLRDALTRARDVPALAAVVARMRLVEADSTDALASLPAPPDVIVLDPMFPARGKDAASRKKMQLLQRLDLVHDDDDALLEAAMLARPRKIVIKRPSRGPYLAGVKPTYSLHGTTIRYDCLILPQGTTA